MKEHMKLLGLKVRDRVTGFTGIVTTIAFDLYGCVQAVVNPLAREDNSKDDSRWFDTKRLEILSNEPVMEVPSFGMAAAVAGPEAKPARKNLPIMD